MGNFIVASLITFAFSAGIFIASVAHITLL